MSDDQWIRADKAAKLLGLSERSALRYASGPAARIRTSKRTGSKRLGLYRPGVKAPAIDSLCTSRPRRFQHSKGSDSGTSACYTRINTKPTRAWQQLSGFVYDIRSSLRLF
jgi:hypothetical protein